MSTIKTFGPVDARSLAQLERCMEAGDAEYGVLCADGHLGYAQPVGGVIAYEKQLSISGVGFDIGCGNMAVRLDVPFSTVQSRVGEITKDIAKIISFGVGRANAERAEHGLFDDGDAWRASDMEAYRQKAVSQLGTVGSGNHYVNVMEDEAGRIWVGVHFGSRGLGHKSATHYLKLAGGKDGMDVAPTVVSVESELGQRYLAAMTLAGEYAYAGREWVVETVRRMLCAKVLDTVHNHHNYAWHERHGERDLWVVRKGATPAFPGQRGFVGGSMGDDAVILSGIENEDGAKSLYSTVHGAGRVMSRTQAKGKRNRKTGEVISEGRISHDAMQTWLRDKGVHLVGGDLDEAPQAYRRLTDVLAQHAGTVKIEHTLRPFIVVMAGADVFDPFKD